MKTLSFVFIQVAEPFELRFIECEDENGKSVSVGKWIAEGDYHILEIDIKELENK